MLTPATPNFNCKSPLEVYISNIEWIYLHTNNPFIPLLGNKCLFQQQQFQMLIGINISIFHPFEAVSRYHDRKLQHLNSII